MPSHTHWTATLAHAQERLICYVAQDAGYTTEQIINSRLAGWNYAMLEYKLQKLEAALPNSDFNYQCRVLEEWRAAGYPTSQLPAAPPPPAPRPPPSVGRPLRELRLATKRRLRDAERDVLRPLLHALSMRGRRSR